MDGHIMCCGTIGSRESAATSEIVKVLLTTSLTIYLRPRVILTFYIRVTATQRAFSAICTLSSFVKFIGYSSDIVLKGIFVTYFSLV